MEPKHSSPEFSAPTPEVLQNQNAPERAGESVLPAFEQGNESTPERASEYAVASQASVAAQATPVVLPTPVSDSAADGTLNGDDSSPAVAADEDLIEKEWVDKAKQIISSTRDDPARREREVGRLQVDYLKKRYGKELGTTTE